MIRVAKRVAHVIVALSACGVVMLVGKGDALAQGKSADCTIFEIKASSPQPPPAQRVAKSLKDLEKKLSKGPFKQWSRFDKLAKHSPVKLARMKAVEVGLKPGGKSKLSMLLRGVVKVQGSKARVQLSLTVDDKKGKRVINTGIEQDSGDYFLIVESRLAIPGGDHILAISCTAK